jgi:four helix bundle protein
MPFRFESLKIWHMAREYTKVVYALTAKFPRKEDYGLTSQINRAVHSIALNIAEGSAKKSGKHFDLFLDNAIGSVFEVVSGGFQALDQNYINQAELDQLYAQGETLAKAINAFRRTLKPD